MKNLLVLVAVFAVIGTASAALVTNGDFEAVTGPATLWEFADGGGATAGEETTGGNPDGHITIDNVAENWAVWYQSISEKLTTIGIPAESTVTFSVDIKSIGTGNLVSGGLKAESWDGDVGAISDSGDQLFTTTTSWATYTYDYTLVAGADALKFVLLNVNYGNGTPAMYGYDNAEILIPGGTPALYPVPTVGNLLPTVSTELTWVEPAGTISADAWLLESDTPLNDPNLGPVIFDGSPTALTVTGNSADVTGLITDGKYYYWAVHVNTGSVVKGYTWNFVGSSNLVPVVDAGDDQYLEVTASPMVLSLDATITDDDTPTILWTDATVATDKDPDTTVVINSPAAEDTTVTLTNTVSGVVMGFYQFEISVDDGVNPAVTDQVTVGVYGTCADAAAADPADTYDAIGDLDGSCKVDLTDFALFAATWLDCDSLRITCP